MRIGLFSDTYLPDINGVVTSVELLRKKLEERGHDVYVICTYPGVLKVVKEGNIIRLPGLEIKKLYGYAVTTPLHPLLYEDIEKLGLDLIHVHTEFGVGIFAEMCAAKFDLPVVRTYHTTYEDYTHYVNFLDLDVIDSYAKKLVASLTKVFADRATKMISPSKKTKEMLLRYGVKTDIAIIPTGTELYRFKKETSTEEDIQKVKEEVGLKEGQELILYVGRIAQEKSLEMLIEAFKILKEKRAPMKLVIIGGGPQLDELVKSVKTQDLEDYIYFGNKRPFDLVPHYYHSADAFVSASTSETQGMTYVEAMASGLVVFARHDESTEDLIQEGENGFYFDGASELADKLLAFHVLDKDTRKKMADVGEKIASEYDADVFCDKILKVYDEAIEEYSHYFTLKETKLKSDYVIVTLEKGNKESEEVIVSLDNFYNMGLRKNTKIKEEVVKELKEKEMDTKAYRACLARLASRDYSIYEMREYLKDKFMIIDTKQDEIISKLIEKGLLDDYQYAISKISLFSSKFFSRNKMISNLKKVHIADEIIAKVISDDGDEEYKKALKRAYYYQSTIKGKSLKAKKDAIYRKLLTDGFSSDIVKRAIESLDMSEDILREDITLRKEALKQKKHYMRKYSGTELRNRVFRSLAAKGFNYDDIYAIINEMEWKDE